jgi:hypothetical protein
MLTQKMLAILTDAAGDFTGYIPNLVPGRVVAVKIVVPAAAVTNGLANDSDLTITGRTTGLGILLDATVAVNATTWWFPLIPAAKAADGTASTLSEVQPFVIQEDIQVVVADESNGAAKVATVYVYIDQGA